MRTGKWTCAAIAASIASVASLGSAQAEWFRGQLHIHTNESTPIDVAK